MGRPNVIIAEAADNEYAALAYQAFAHPALAAAATRADAVVRTDKSWSCGGPFTVAAVERLKAAADGEGAGRQQ